MMAALAYLPEAAWALLSWGQPRVLAIDQALLAHGAFSSEMKKTRLWFWFVSTNEH